MAINSLRKSSKYVISVAIQFVKLCSFECLLRWPDVVGGGKWSTVVNGVVSEKYEWQTSVSNRLCHTLIDLFILFVWAAAAAAAADVVVVDSLSCGMTNRMIRNK